MSPGGDQGGPPDHAGVKVPPPLLFGGGILAAIGLEWLAPLGGPAPEPLFWTGAGLLALAVVVILSLAVRFKRAGTAIEPWKPASALLRGGLYGRSRNPIYVSMMLAYVGVALMLASPWAIPPALVVLPVMRWHVVAREEAYLERRFGAEYLAYKAAVPRWL